MVPKREKTSNLVDESQSGDSWVWLFTPGIPALSRLGIEVGELLHVLGLSGPHRIRSLWVTE